MSIPDADNVRRWPNLTAEITSEAFRRERGRNAPKSGAIFEEGSTAS